MELRDAILLGIKEYPKLEAMGCQALQAIYKESINEIDFTNRVVENNFNNELYISFSDMEGIVLFILKTMAEYDLD